MNQILALFCHLNEVRWSCTKLSKFQKNIFLISFQFISFHLRTKIIELDNFCSYLLWCHNAHHNDTQHNNIQQNYIQLKDIQHNNIKTGQSV
jgi:hypothetical protein